VAGCRSRRRLTIGSHLAIDSLSPKGIDWLFPLRTSWSPGLAVHSPAATVVLWAASIGIPCVGRGRTPVDSLKPRARDTIHGSRDRRTCVVGYPVGTAAVGSHTVRSSDANRAAEPASRNARLIRPFWI